MFFIFYYLLISILIKKKDVHYISHMKYKIEIKRIEVK